MRGGGKRTTAEGPKHRRLALDLEAWSRGEAGGQSRWGSPSCKRGAGRAPQPHPPARPAPPPRTAARGRRAAPLGGQSAAGCAREPRRRVTRVP